MAGGERRPLAVDDDPHKDLKLRPHRCNDRIEDFLQALFTVEYSKISSSWHIMWKCVKSQPGQEPSEPYQVIKDGKKYLEGRKRKVKTPFDD